MSHDLNELVKIIAIAKKLKESSKAEDWIDESEVRKIYNNRQVSEL